ncbi:flagellin [Paenibacillus larvae]|uniref:Flagellin n=1 Tax=Paenibacillus larvae TaxID=1464 RepID=A0AAP5N2H3_9BACL|nr:flagellin [Paenibacillus larvae]AQR78617.1 flagellin [Paenibacillus larvae subsp. larvae]AVF20129.1 flagellin [Paenibacillus larvae subsp. larvae]ETK29218.1 flagellin [Paenibacillus larvae subsp. larvae DSM 25719]MCY7489170.1 flagellin [Paenibacillus larvae]MCY9564027.1 flagellin [Paenibacillus larvae]
MIINHNITAMNTHRNIGINNLSSSKSMEKLSSGLRINRAADDAAGLSISEKMRSQIRGLQQAQRNAQDGVSLVQTAEGAMNEISDMLVRMKELTIQRANGTFNEDDKANLDLEMIQLAEEIKNIQEKTKFNGKEVFKTDNEFKIVTGDSEDVSLVIKGADISQAAGLLEKLKGKEDSKAPEDPKAPEDAKIKVSDIEDAIKQVNTARSTLGAQQNRLEHTVNNLGTTTENLQAAESRIRDTDMASEMVKLTKDNILLQASQAMLAQANQHPQGVLQLLR